MTKDKEDSLRAELANIEKLLDDKKLSVTVRRALEERVKTLNKKLHAARTQTCAVAYGKTVGIGAPVWRVKAPSYYNRKVAPGRVIEAEVVTAVSSDGLKLSYSPSRYNGHYNYIEGDGFYATREDAERVLHEAYISFLTAAQHELRRAAEKVQIIEAYIRKNSK